MLLVNHCHYNRPKKDLSSLPWKEALPEGNKGDVMRIVSKWWLGVIVGICYSLVIWPGPQPVRAMSSGDTLVLTTVPIASVAVVGAAGYLLYKNRLSQPATAKGALGYRGPGEFYLGGFLGASLLPDATWTYQIAGQNYKASNMGLDPGVTGGIKLGYFSGELPLFRP